MVQMGVEAHEDNQIMVQMGERARQDNNNMKLIALVGLVYLPGTFVSSLFGMNFFSFDEENGQQRWQVSEKFWLYWAITAPLTLCTLIIWALANYKGVTKQHLKAFMQLSKGAGKVGRD
jgi:Mg2+ and Co2+ transporter CorA